MTADDGMTNTPLNFDVARCHDNHCQRHNSCLRWIDRRNTGEWTPHYATLGNKYGECDSYIPESKYARYR